MLSFEDCLGLCELTEREIRAIAEHEHLPEIVAAELGQYLLHQPGGTRRIKRIILDDFAAAKSRGDARRALMWRTVFRGFVQAHPKRPPPPKNSRADLAPARSDTNPVSSNSVDAPSAWPTLSAIAHGGDHAGLRKVRRAPSTGKSKGQGFRLASRTAPRG